MCAVVNSKDVIPDAVGIVGVARSLVKRRPHRHEKGKMSSATGGKAVVEVGIGKCGKRLGQEVADRGRSARRPLDPAFNRQIARDRYRRRRRHGYLTRVAAVEEDRAVEERRRRSLIECERACIRTGIGISRSRVRRRQSRGIGQLPEGRRRISQDDGVVGHDRFARLFSVQRSAFRTRTRSTYRTRRW